MSLPDVASLIPHRGRWRLLDDLVEIGPDRIVGRFHATEALCDGHFPERRVVPGVVLVEGLAQTMLCLARLQPGDSAGTPLLVGLDRVRFRSPVLPPATVLFEVVVEGRRGAMLQCSGRATCDDRRVLTCKLTGTVVDLEA